MADLCSICGRSKLAMGGTACFFPGDLTCYKVALRRANELNHALVSQNCKLIERNRDLGDTAPPLALLPDSEGPR